MHYKNFFMTDTKASIIKSISLLRNIKNTALKLAKKKSFGIFGTSIAGTWLFNELQSQVEFFVDEDPNRIGLNYLDRPVYHPKDIPLNSSVFVAVYPRLALTISRRMKNTYSHFKIYTGCEF